MKNNIDVFYFSTLYPLHILFVEDGKMGESQHGCHPLSSNPPGRVPSPGDGAGSSGQPESHGNPAV